MAQDLQHELRLTLALVCRRLFREANQSNQSIDNVLDSSDARLHALEARISSLDLEYQALSRLLARAGDERLRTKRARNRILNLRTPIHRLPDEILSSILLHTLPFSHSSNLREMRSTLSVVCQRWRAVMKDTPRVWCWIDHRLNQCSSKYLPLQIERAKSAPLHLSLHRQHHDNRSLQIGHQWFKSFIHPYLSYIRHMRVSVGDLEDELLDEGVLSSLVELEVVYHRTPLRGLYDKVPDTLRKLDIWAQEGRGTCSHHVHDFNPVNLTHLTIWLGWDAGNVVDFWSLIERAPSLVELQITLPSRSITDLPNIISLRSLKTLFVSSFPLAALICAPALSNIDLESAKEFFVERGNLPSVHTGVQSVRLWTWDLDEACNEEALATVFMHSKLEHISIHTLLHLVWPPFLTSIANRLRSIRISYIGTPIGHEKMWSSFDQDITRLLNHLATAGDFVLILPRYAHVSATLMERYKSNNLGTGVDPALDLLSVSHGKRASGFLDLSKTLSAPSRFPGRIVFEEECTLDAFWKGF